MEASSSSNNVLEHLVVDSCAIMKGNIYGFHKIAKNYWTVPEALREIRDEKSRELLNALPFTLEVKNPNEEAMKFISDFAKKSGDYASLSVTDLKLLALTYMLETKEITEKLRKEPKKYALMLKSKSKSADVSSVANDIEKLSLKSEFRVVLPSESTSEHPDEAVVDVSEGDESDNDVEQEGLYDEDLESDNDEDSEGNQPEASSTIQEEVDIGDSQAFPSLSASMKVTKRRYRGAPPPSEIPVPTPQPSTDSKPTVSWASMARLPNNNSKVVPVFSVASKELPAEKVEAAVGATTSKSGGGQWDCLSGDVDTDEELITTGKINNTKSVLPSAKPAPVSGSRINLSAANPMSLSTIVSADKAALEDDGEGWANPENIDSLRANNQIANMVVVSSSTGTAKKPKKANAKSYQLKNLNHVAGCVTSDFTMQNILLQIGMPIISCSDGMRIRNATSFVLRCAGCYEVHFDMSKMFCTRCGNAMLQRIACSINEDSGDLRLHLKKNYHYNLQGTKYSLPKPGTRDRYAGEVLLREDQLFGGIWKYKLNQVDKDVKSAFGADVTADVGINVSKSQTKVQVGMGKRNPNRVRNTGNRKKKSH